MLREGADVKRIYESKIKCGITEGCTGHLKFIKKTKKWRCSKCKGESYILF